MKILLWEDEGEYGSSNIGGNSILFIIYTEIIRVVSKLTTIKYVDNSHYLVFKIKETSLSLSCDPCD